MEKASHVIKTERCVIKNMVHVRKCFAFLFLVRKSLKYEDKDS